jgi:hypothetical protein
MELHNLADTMHAFEAALADTNTLLMPEGDRLLNTQLRSFARSSISRLVYESYLFLYNAVMDPANEYQNPQSLFIYTPEQVKTMVDTL